MTDPAALEALARRIAEDAHAGQVDKVGESYINHVSRVAGRLEDPLDRAVAWLHDVLEDTNEQLTDLWERGTHHRLGAGSVEWAKVCADVALLTRKPGERRSDYYDWIKESPRAVRVKLADIDDNTDLARMARLDEATRERLVEKYRKAREALGAEVEA